MNHRLFIQGVPVVISACLAPISSVSAQVPDLPPQVTDRDTLHRWLLQLKSRDAQAVDDAIRFFPRIKPDAEDAETIGLLTLGLKDRNAYARKYSAGCLIKLGPAGAAAIPELEAMLTDAELQGGVREWASRALVGMWPRSEEALGRALQSDDHDVRWAVGQYLYRAPEPDPVAADEMATTVAVAGVPLPSLARTVPIAVYRPPSALGPVANPRLARRFAGLMTNEDPEVRLRAVRAVRYLGADAQMAMAPLLGIIDREGQSVGPGKDRHLRARILVEVASTLTETGTADEKATGALISLTSHGDDSVRVAAARALGGVKARPEYAIPTLTRLLENRSREVGIAAAVSLGRYGPKAQTAVGRMTKLLLETNHVMSRSYIIEAIESIDPKVGGELRKQVPMP